uniref:TIR domain-containing protein n=1 Tax=Clytia hemisphaerica TaxID=252671 RepID=A0A7M5UXE9_9CNID
MATASTNHDEKSDLFLSHDWGEDGKTNHEKVAKINQAIKNLGYRTWFDNERMVGNIREQMANGIVNTRCFIAFITKRYHDKVVNGTETDNCRAEFDFASIRVPMIAIVLESSMKNPLEWKGNFALTLAPRLYIDLSGDINDDGYLSNQIKLLKKDLESKGIFPNQSLEVESMTNDSEGLKKQEETTCQEIPRETLSLSKMKRRADILRENGEYPDAILLYQKVTERLNSTLGKNNKQTLKSEYWLAWCYFHQNLYKKAAAIFKDVLERQTTTLGCDHEDTIQTALWMKKSYTNIA